MKNAAENIIEQAIQKLMASGLASAATIQGCSEGEVAELEKTLDLRFPHIYQLFLRYMGKSAGQFLQGSDYLLSTLPTLKPQAETLLHENKSKFFLSKTDMVFLMHQGYQFMFFDASGPQDPPVFLFLDRELAPNKVYDHFSQWLLDTLKDEIVAFQTNS